MTRLLRFDETALRHVLGQLSPADACALSLASACRLFSCITSYRLMAGFESAQPHEHVAARLWDDLLSNTFPTPTIGWDVVYKSVLSLIPGESDPWNEWHPLAEDGAAALAYGVDVWSNGNLESAVYALRRLYEATDQLAINRLGLTQLRKQDEETIVSQYCVQQEMTRQSRDIALAQQGNRKSLHQVSRVESILD